MISTQLHDLLSLFAMTVFADKRVYAQEIETFLSVAARLQEAQIIEPGLSEAKLLAWYEMNKDKILATISTPDFEEWFCQCLKSLDHIKNKSLILKIMADIAKSDDEFHVSEKALIVLTAREWNVEVEAYL